MELWRKKNVDTRILFPIINAAGDFVSGAAGLDSEWISYDTADHGQSAPSFADCTHEATEIGSTGIYYLDLQAAEINKDFTLLRIQTSTVGAKTQVILISTLMRDANVANWKGSAAPDLTGDPYAEAVLVHAHVSDCATATALSAAKSVVDAIKAKTDLIPASPAAVGSAMTLAAAYDAAKTAASQATLNALDAIVDDIHDTDLLAVKTDSAAIKAKTDNLPASPAAVGSKMDLADSLSSAGLGILASAVWSELLTELTTTGSIGKLIKDYLDAAVSSRLATAGYTTPPSVGAIADQVFDELLSGHTTEGSAGKAISEASAPTTDEIDSQLSGTHGAGAWGSSAVGSITYPDPLEDPQPFLDPNDDPLAGVKVEAYSDEDRTTLVDVQVTDINGLFAFHLDAGTYYFRAILAGYGNFEWSVELTA
jgi:hypothetical protein